MFNNCNEIKEINLYFKKFLLLNNCFSGENINMVTKEKIIQMNDVPFNSDWNYLMVLIQSIESHFNTEKVVFHDNYARIEINSENGVQDKGPYLIDALYSCCYQLLNKHWKGINPPKFNSGCEPFDEIDLK